MSEKSDATGPADENQIVAERRRKLKYVVALSEVSAVPMADGYARATRALVMPNFWIRLRKLPSSYLSHR